jgi:glycosyltransferase involved in cell wall biosynthesis
MYQPGSVVYHIEGSTSGNDITKGIKQHQVTNGQKFANRWFKELSSHGEPETDPDNEKDRFAKKRVLFLDHNLPTPDRDAGSGVAINTMILLREFGFQVTFAAPKNWVYDEIYTQLLQKHGIETLHEPYQISLESHLADCGSRYDLVIGCRANILVESLPLLKIHCPKVPVVFHTADLHFLRLEREAQVSKNWNTMKIAEEYKNLEPWLVDQTNVTIIHGDYEKSLLESMGADPNKLVVFPLMINVPEKRTSFESRNGIIFVGGFNHTPNVDAVEFMSNEVMPLLSNSNPEIVLTVVGSNVTKEIEALETSNVKIVGHVHELDEYLQTFKISVAPLRYGAGLKGKVAKAMATGTPVVASRVAMEGINLMPEKDFLLANSPEEIAKQISRLYNDEALWEKISQNSYDHSHKLWGFDPAVQSLKEVLSKVGLAQDSPTAETKFL